MAREDRIAKWVRRVLSDPMMTGNGERKAIALALMHVTSGIRSEVQAVKLGARVWDPIQLAEMFDALATEHAAGLASSESGSGEESYQVVAFYDDFPERPVSPLPLMKHTGPSVHADDPIVSEPPTAKGELAMTMRHSNAWQEFTLQMNAKMYATMSGIIDRLSSRLSAVEKENIDAFAIAKDMILEKAADSHDQRMKELAFERSSEERARVMKALPPLVNRVFGKEIFPNSTVDSSLFEALVESSDEGQMSRIVEALLPVLKPEQAALLMGRLGDIQDAVNARKAEAAKKAAAHANGTNGTNGNGVAKS